MTSGIYPSKQSAYLHSPGMKVRRVYHTLGRKNEHEQSETCVIASLSAVTSLLRSSLFAIARSDSSIYFNRLIVVTMTVKRFSICDYNGINLCLTTKFSQKLINFVIGATINI